MHKGRHPPQTIVPLMAATAPPQIELAAVMARGAIAPRAAGIVSVIGAFRPGGADHGAVGPLVVQVG